jgi:glycosyltransferase involved in cell wall biosynthesis
VGLNLSVVMPARNAQDFIRAAVKSTLLAMPSESELIVINDGSTDGTLKILHGFHDSRIRVIEKNFGGGLAATLNLGLENSRSPLIARMDADDICLPWRFRRQLAIFGHPTAPDFLFSTALVFGPKISPYPLIPQLPIGLNDHEFKEFLTFGNPGVHPTMLAKKSSLEELAGYSNTVAEDLHLWLRAALSGYAFRRLAIPGIALRVHSGQTTRQKGWVAASELDGQVALLRSKLLAAGVGVPRNNSAGKLKNRLTELERNGLPKLIAPWKSRQRP